jgi:hypothetical protein
LPHHQNGVFVVEPSPRSPHHVSFNFSLFLWQFTFRRIHFENFFITIIMIGLPTFESSSSSSSSLSSAGQLTRSSVSSLSLSQLSLATSSSSGGWGSTDTRKAYCDLSSAAFWKPQLVPNNLPLATTTPSQPALLLSPTLEQQQHAMVIDDDEDDWGFFVDTYDRFTPEPTRSPTTTSAADHHPPGYVGF